MNRHKSFRIALATVVVAVSTAGLASLGSMASAQNADGMLVRRLNSQEPAAAKATVILRSKVDSLNPKVTVNGAEAPVIRSGKLDLPAANPYLSIVIATGENMKGAGNLDAARAAVSKIFTAAPPNMQFAIFQAGDRASPIQSFTSDRARLEDALKKIGPSTKVALYDAIRQAALPFQSAGNLQPNILVITGDGESVAEIPEKPLAAARGAVVSGGATMFTAYLNTFDPAPVDSIVAVSGGFTSTAADAKTLDENISAMGDSILNQQHEIEFNTGLQKGELAEVTVEAGGKSTAVSVRVGGDDRGSAQLKPQETVGGGGIPILDGPIGLVLVISFTLVAVSALAYAVTLLVVPDDSLTNVLQPYADGYGGGSGGDDDDEGSALGRSALIQRAVEITEQVATSQGYLTRAESALEKANIALRGGEALFAYAVIVTVVTVIGLLYSRSIVIGLVFGGFGAMLPIVIINFLGKRRRKKFMMQLPDTLQLLSGTLRAGYSLMQGLEAVSQEVQDPMGLELRRVVTESRLGRPVEEALEASAERMDSPDFAWAVMAIRIQREVGGNLSELLLTVAETMTARERLRRDVASLTAEGRMSAIILGLLPPGLGAAMFVINPDYTSVLFKETLGIIMLVGAVVAMIIGFLWMRKIINIEI